LSLTFADLGVPADAVARLARRSITTPFPIQAAVVRDALAGHDVCGKAPTGSGKTLAFGLALAERATGGASRRPVALVLVPTRELALQVSTELGLLVGPGQDRRVLAVYGGVGYEAQRKALRRGVNIVVATPGRLEDLVARSDIGLADVACVVIDEADRMADMGFLPAVKRLLDATRSNRQTLLFSATLDGDVDVLVRRYQREPRRHVVEVSDDDAKVDHLFWQTSRSERIEVTAAAVAHHGRAIVFCRTRNGADRLARQLGSSGIRAAAIHGSRSQAQRERALAAFAADSIQALVATDVAARGIHVDAVPCVIHFDPPAEPKDYLHRSGRTGRAGAPGTVITLVGDEHRVAVKALQRDLGLRPGLDAPPGADPRRAVPLRAVPLRAVPPMPARAEAPRRKVAATRGDRPGRATGTVKWFDAKKGFGFIVPERGGRDIFVHQSEIQIEGYRKLSEGQRVQFDLNKGQQGMQAGTVKLVS
jgi:superfamily II DNA/RNA helicase/cold shock CspA family protein